MKILRPYGAKKVAKEAKDTLYGHTMANTKVQEVLGEAVGQNKRENRD